jgi:hypothetical protein
MLGKQLVVLGDVPVVKVGNAEIQKYEKEKGEIKNSKVKPIFFRTDCILHLPVDAKDPERFHQQIEKNKEGEVL